MSKHYYFNMASKLDFLPFDYAEDAFEWGKSKVFGLMNSIKEGALDILVRKPLEFAKEITWSAIKLPFKALYHAPIIPTGGGINVCTPVDNSPSTNQVVWRDL